MFACLALAALVSLSLAGAVPSPSKRTTPLNCVQFQYAGPFASFGEGGLIHFYANITQNDPETHEFTFNETRLGLVNGTIDNCGECRTTELFGFEVCETSDGYGYNGLKNSATEFYGHVTYSNVGSPKQCVQAATTPVNGSMLVLAECLYEYESAGSSAQYFHTELSDGGYPVTLLVVGQSETYGPNPSLDQGEPLSFFDGPAIGPFTYFGYKAPVF